MGVNSKFTITTDITHAVNETGSTNKSNFPHSFEDTGDFIVSNFTETVSLTTYAGVGFVPLLSEVTSDDIYFLYIQNTGAPDAPTICISMDNSNEHFCVFPGFAVWIYPELETDTIYVKKDAAGDDVDLDIVVFGTRA